MEIIDKILIVCIVLLFFTTGCSSDDDEEGISPDGVTVLFTANTLSIDASAVHSRTGGPLAEGTAVRVVAFKRVNESTEASVTGTPAGQNTYTADESGNLSPVTQQMRLSSYGFYDFYIYSGASEFHEGATDNVRGINHGVDFLAGKNLGVRVVGMTPVTVDFGSLEHLCTMVQFSIRTNDTFDTPPTLGGILVTMSKVATQPATLSFSSFASSAALVPANSNEGTFSMENDIFTYNESSTSMSGERVMLPTSISDSFDLQFDLTVNGSPLTLHATGIGGILAFEKGKRYSFVLEFGLTQLTLKLNLDATNSIPDWENTITWDSEIGSGNLIVIGSWKVISWGSEMGSSNILTVGAWNPCLWDHTIGNGNVTTPGRWNPSSWDHEIGEADAQP